MKTNSNIAKFNIDLRSNLRFKSVFILSLILIVWLIYSGYVTLSGGLDTWSIDNNVVWGLAITNFVFWIGIAHAGTLISAILYLFRQDWRKPISKVSESMTIIAIICAAFFPLIHMGRPWFAYWIIPGINRLGLNTNFYSPLTWDFFAIATYFIVSSIFLYLSFLPYFSRLAPHLRSKSMTKMYSILGMNWIGTESQWGIYNTAYKLIAGLASALVISVHSIVSYDFAVTHLTGWHSTIFPPYFVIGAILSGCAMLISILSLFAWIHRVPNAPTMFKFNKIAKVILFCINAIAFVYITEIFFAWYSASGSEMLLFNYRLGVPYYFMLICIVVLPQVLWLRKLRNNAAVLVIVSILINIGMWLERYFIIISSLNIGNDKIYIPNMIEIGLFAGSFGVFLILLLFAFKYLPIIEFNKKS